MPVKKVSNKDLYKLLIPESKQTNLIHELTKIPPREAGDNMPHYQIFKEGYLQQADLLFMPTDAFGFKYALVVVDAHSRKLDAEPIKNKDSSTIIKAFTKIYKRGILKYPIIIGFDPGSEFKNKEVKSYFTDHDVYVKYGQVNRHRQQSLVEGKNYILGINLNKIMNAKELETGKTSKQWTKYLPKLIELLNKNLPKPITKAISDTPIITKENQNILSEGDKVRVALDYPKSASNDTRLSGRFRAGDLRFDKKIEKIEQVNIKPGFPPLYQVEDHQGVNYTSQQLQPINKPWYRSNSPLRRNNN